MRYFRSSESYKLDVKKIFPLFQFPPSEMAPTDQKEEEDEDLFKPRVVSSEGAGRFAEENKVVNHEKEEFQITRTRPEPEKFWLTRPAPDRVRDPKTQVPINTSGVHL